MGTHYTVLAADKPGMELLRAWFGEMKPDELNLVYFSTSGVHSTYQTIEEEEKEPGTGVAFSILEPRRVRIIYGNCYPETPEDFAFLKELRRLSHEVFLTIGVGHSPEGEE